MNRHELDPVSLIFGFAFTGLGLLFLIGRADQALRLQWVWPLLLLALGAGILLDLTRSHDRKTPEADLRSEVGAGAGPGVGIEDRIGAGIGDGVEDGFGDGVGAGVEEDGVGVEDGVGRPVDDREQLR